MADDHILQPDDGFIGLSSTIKPVKPVSDQSLNEETEAKQEKPEIEEKSNG